MSPRATAKRRRLLRLGQKPARCRTTSCNTSGPSSATAPAGRADGRSSEASWTSPRGAGNERTHSNIDDAGLRSATPNPPPNRSGRAGTVGDRSRTPFGTCRGTCTRSRHVLRRCDAVAERALRKRGVAYETTLSEVVDRSRLHVGRLLHYFPRDASGTWCGWHNDNSIITALAPALFYDAAGSEVPAPPGAGLTAMSRSGAEHRVAPPRGSVLFQIGEAAQILTAGALMATPHAVQAGELASCSREAFALFVEPAWDEPLDVPRGCARADALADYGETIPPLAKRLPRLPVAFAQFLADSVKEYY